jgi:hypothetical protein
MVAPYLQKNNSDNTEDVEYEEITSKIVLKTINSYKNQKAPIGAFFNYKALSITIGTIPCIIGIE